MSKIAFVTGGTGFVGSHLVEALLKRDYSEIRCLIRSHPKWLTGMNIVSIEGTLSDSGPIKAALQGVDYVYHLGALTRARSWEEFYDANVTSTANLIQHASSANVSKVCIVSSLAVAGDTGTLIADESTECHPISMYGQSKLEMEQMLHDIDHPTVIIRPPVVYGPRDRDLLTFFSAMNRKICVAPSNDAGLSMVYVKDLVRGLIDGTESDQTTGHTYYLGNSDVTVTWETLREATEAALNKKSILIRLPRQLILPLGMLSEFGSGLFGQFPAFNREKARELLYTTKLCNSDRAFHDFGYYSKVSLPEGIEETIAWYQEQGWLK